MSVSDMCSSKQRLVTLPTTASVAEALRTLDKNRILAVPLMSPKADVFVGFSDIKIGDDRVVGIISVLDLVAHVFRALTVDDGPLAVRARGALATPVWRVLGSTDESLTLWAEEGGQGIETALGPFAFGIHRSIVIPCEGTPKLLTQSDVLKYLLEKRTTSAELGRVLGRSLRELDLGSENPLVKCTTSSRLTDVLGTMVQRTVHAVAVVDGDNGLLLSTLSISDLRGISSAEELMSLEDISVGEFLLRDQLSATEAASDLVFPLPLTCRVDDTLGQIVDQMLSRNVHRSWVVGKRPDAGPTILQGHGLPIGVVTYTDVIRIVYNTMYRWNHSSEF